MEIVKYILLALLLIIVLWCLFVVICAYAFVDKNKFYETDSKFYRWLLTWTTKLLLWPFGVRIKCSGTEKLPKDTRYLLIQNHRSNYDPITTWTALESRQLAFISKEQNFNVPIWGRIIRKCCFMSIDREDPRKALPTIKKAAELMKNDVVSIAVYPEGTRSKDCVLREFHAAIFKIAQMANVPVVVTAIRGTEKIHKQLFYRRSYVYLDILEVIPAERVKAMKSTELSEECRRIVADFLISKGEEVERAYENN